MWANVFLFQYSFIDIQDMDRQRVVQPSEGMQFSTVLVISFHPVSSVYCSLNLSINLNI